MFLPKSITCLRGYSRASFVRDAAAGLTVGVVALPLSLAFGIASVPEDVAASAGLSPPAIGLITAVIAGFVISALGGSRVNIGGPTGAFVGIVYTIAATHGWDGLVFATMLAGVFLVIMGLAKLGGMIKYIPYPVTTGFTSGIAVVIAVGQIRDIAGLDTGALPPDMLARLEVYAASIHSASPAALAVGVGTIALIQLMRRFGPKRIPGPVVAIALATVVVHIFGLGVETIGDRFGAIPTGIPAPRLPSIDAANLPNLIGPALTIAVLAAVESLLCAVVADGSLGTRHRSNTELIAQGAANIVTPLFGGIPATSAIARTATNIQAGGRTPVAGMVHALTLLAVLLVVGRYATLIPLASLAGVLMVVAYNMSEIRNFRWHLRAPKSDVAVLLTTFSLTVFVDLSVAVQVGVVLAALLFMKRMADVTNVASIQNELSDPREDAPLGPAAAGRLALPPGVQVYEIDGPFFFGAAYKMREALDAVASPPDVLILDMTRVTAVDATGLHALDELRRRALADGTRLILVGVHAQPMFAMSRSRTTDTFGAESFAGTIADALALVVDRPPQPDADDHRPGPT
ncbi:MAG: STAS domain-containing protein [Planctomycetota bacterium]|nr:MAG: STAS domain-containing protein [Planctomycetota bacterium]